ncbi:XRE family transcriptional regulator [Idiomarina xiamenensis]|nr:XRE family transcriptional regulator [Idiomarina xiamenensis]
MSKKAAIGDRIRHARLMQSLTQGELAKKVGVTLASVSQWELGTNTPRPPKVKKLAEQLKVDIEWLYTGVTPGTEVQEPAAAYNVQPAMTQVRALVDDADAELRYIANSQVKSAALDASSLAYLDAPDDSMVPSINRGDMLIVDTSDKIIKDSKIYVIQYGSSLRVRRLFSRINGLLLRSDNTDVSPDEILPPNEQDAIEVVGRVVLRVGML